MIFRLRGSPEQDFCLLGYMESQGCGAPSNVPRLTQAAIYWTASEVTTKQTILFGRWLLPCFNRCVQLSNSRVHRSQSHVTRNFG